MATVERTEPLEIVSTIAGFVCSGITGPTDHEGTNPIGWSAVGKTLAPAENLVDEADEVKVVFLNIARADLVKGNRPVAEAGLKNEAG